jgi:hypothetical protein
MLEPIHAPEKHRLAAVGRFLEQFELRRHPELTPQIEGPLRQDAKAS